MSRAAWVALLLCAAACKHEPEVKPEREEAAETSAALGGQLVVGLTDVFGQDAVLEAVALDGYRFEYVAASSDTSHLVKVSAADGARLSEEQTAEVAAKLKGRPNVRFVELNRMRQPR